MDDFYKIKRIIKQNKTIEEFKHYLNNATDINPVNLSLLLKEVVLSRQNDFADFFDELVKKGANVNFCQQKDSKSIMMYACQTATAEVIRHLLTYPIKIDHRDTNLKNCLFYALENKRKQDAPQIIEAILDKHPSLVHIVASNKSSLLSTAVEKSKAELVKVLLERGADPNECISDTLDTPLHIAVKALKVPVTVKIYKTIIKMLIQHEADVTLKNKQGKTPLDIDNAHKAFILNEIEMDKVEKLRRKAIYRLNKPSDIENLFSEAEKHLEDWMQHNPEPIVIPISQLYLTSQQLQHYLECSITKYYRDVEQKAVNDRQVVHQLVDKLRIILSGYELSVELFGSYATGLNMDHSDVNIALIPTGILSFEHEQLMEFVEKELLALDFKKSNIKDMGCIRMQCNEKYSHKQINLTFINQGNIFLEQLKVFDEYLAQYPVIKSIWYVIKTMLHTANLMQDYQPNIVAQKITTYALFIMITAFVQNELNFNLFQNNHNSGRLLINLLRFFAYEFEYKRKGIYLPVLQTDYKQFTFDIKYYLPEPKLIIIANLLNIGPSQTITKLIQDAFRIGFVTIHINYNCEKKCTNRTVIQKLAIGKYEDSLRPCCILDRLFNCHNLLY